jgi:large conductance mechanosensitive channel
MSFLSEFKAFVLKGNVIDLAVGFIMGIAFGKIISSLVGGILMPFLGLLLGGINIAGMTFKVGDAVIQWGMFLQMVIDFTVIAFCMFLLIKMMSMLQRQTPAPLSQQEILLTEIRDLLRQKIG